MLIHGGPKSGKSTALQTFILSAAACTRRARSASTAWTTAAVSCGRWRTWRMSAAWPRALEPERIRRTFGELEQLLRSRQQREAFRDGSDGPLDDGYGEVFLVIDNLYAFSRDNTDQFNTRNPLLAKVTELVNIGLAYGIHVVITTPSWLEVPLAMRDGLGLRLELKLHDAAGQQRAGGRCAAPPGRGGARRPAGPRPDHGRRALPVRRSRIWTRSPRSTPATRAWRAPPVRLLPTEPGARSGRRAVSGRRSGSSSGSAKRTWRRWRSTSPTTRC